MAIASELSLDKVLKQIVDSACELVGHSMALGVANVDNYLDLFVHSGMTAETAAAIPHLPRGYGLLGAIVKEKRSIRLPNISDDPRSVGFPEGHPPMSSFLGCPLCLARKRWAIFT
jgi:GAF domain-containing protein